MPRGRPSKQPLSTVEQEISEVTQSTESAEIESEDGSVELPDDTIIETGHSWSDRPRPLDVELKDPNLTPGWVSLKRLDFSRAQGWEPTTSDMVKSRGNMPGYIPESGKKKVVYQDVMLHHMPKARYEAREKYYAKKTSQQMALVRQNLESEIGTQGGLYGKIEH